MNLSSIFPKEPDGAKSKTFAKVLAWGVGLTFAVLIAPIIFMAVTGIVGLFLALGVTYIGLKLAPVVGMMTSNLALKMVRWEARRNPVETKMQLYADDLKVANEFDTECKEFNNEVESYRTQVEKFVRQYPDQAAGFLEELKNYEELRQARYDALADLRENLVLQSKDIERSRAIWEMTKANDRMSKLAGKLSEKDATKQIMESEANKAIEDGRARSRAALIHLKNVQAGKHPPKEAPAALPSPVEVLLPGSDNIYASNPAKVPVPVYGKKSS